MCSLQVTPPRQGQKGLGVILTPPTFNEPKMSAQAVVLPGADSLQVMITSRQISQLGQEQPWGRTSYRSASHHQAQHRAIIERSPWRAPPSKGSKVWV